MLGGADNPMVNYRLISLALTYWVISFHENTQHVGAGNGY